MVTADFSAAFLVSAFHIGFGAVLEGVFHGVVVEVLVDEVTAIGASADGLSFNRPLVFHPAHLINVVNEEVAESTARSPQEAVEMLDLPLQFALIHLRITRQGKAAADPDRAAAKRAFEAMMDMGKIDIAAIEAARKA